VSDGLDPVNESVPVPIELVAAVKVLVLPVKVLVLPVSVEAA
jgi:hypothetical protein